MLNIFKIHLAFIHLKVKVTRKKKTLKRGLKNVLSIFFNVFAVTGNYYALVIYKDGFVVSISTGLLLLLALHHCILIYVCQYLCVIMASLIKKLKKALYFIEITGGRAKGQTGLNSFKQSFIAATLFSG